MNRKMLLQGMLGLMLVVLLLVGCGAPAATPTATLVPVGELTVTYEYPAYSLPFVVAMEKGFFREENVQVVPMKIGTGDTVDIADVDVINGHEFYLLKEARGQILCLHPISRTADYEKAMLVKKSAGISDWPDFKGKTIVLMDIGDSDLLDRTFQQYGLDGLGGDVTFKGGSGAIANFAEDQNVHALYGWWAKVLFLMRTYPGEFEIRWKDLSKEEISQSRLFACSYVKTATVKQKYKAIQAYAKAIDRAIDFVREDPQSAVRFLPKYFGGDQQWASNMEVHYYLKSDEVVDLEALSHDLGMDVTSSFLTLSGE